VQLHGTVSTAELIKLRKLNNSLYVIKSLVVKKHNLAELEFMVGELSSLVDAFITDTYDPVTGASGATGKSHDWAISRRLVDISPRPVILAGGLRPENLREAILTVRPFGVDVHTGVEGVDGRKAEYLVRDFITVATAAFADVNRLVSS
jgi:phosphoribosylanthranilate isomerase